MDITKITDINELKSMAYDQLLSLENTQRNLQMVQQRITQVEETKK